MASNNTEIVIKLEEKSYSRALEQLDELNRRTYVLAKLLKHSWLLRLVFGVNLKKLDVEMSDGKI
jgi:hypothetical protein